MNSIETEISIARIYYPVHVLGPGRRVGIWTTGCTRNCEGCVSPELQRHDLSKMLPISEIAKMIDSIKGDIDGFTISGGEPFYDPRALYELVSVLEEISDDILIYTGYTLSELKASKSRYIEMVLDKCSALIDGPYVGSLNDGIGLRGSANQTIHVFRHRDRYPDPEKAVRQIQTIVYGNGVLTIGIPYGDSK